MRKNSILSPLLKMVFVVILVGGFISCNKIVDKATEPERVDMTIDIGGVKSEMTSYGFALFDVSSNKRELHIPFLSANSLLTVNAIKIIILDFKEGKAIYLAEKGEVLITYSSNVEVFEGSAIEWKAEKGGVEITSFNKEIIEGKLNATLGTAKIKNKIVELKNGIFKVKTL